MVIPMLSAKSFLRFFSRVPTNLSGAVQTKSDRIVGTAASTVIRRLGRRLGSFHAALIQSSKESLPKCFAYV
jgi:hypothetical protein